MDGDNTSYSAYKSSVWMYLLVWATSKPAGALGSFPGEKDVCTRSSQ
jgi:hypothetical protein